MGNVVGSAVTGISEVVGKLLGHPLDFLAGKYCSNCGPTWDLTCYIEHFCISHLLKLGLVVLLLYFVLLFFYLTYKLRIFQCICHTICRSIWACCAMYFSTIECCCTFLCSKLDNHNRRRRRKRRRAVDLEEAMAEFSSEEYDDDDDDPQSPKNHNHRTKRRRPVDLEEVVAEISSEEFDDDDDPQWPENHNRRRRTTRRRVVDLEEAVAEISSEEFDDDDDDPQLLNHVSIIQRRKLQSGQTRVSRKEQDLRRALRPKSHRLQVGISEKPIGSNRRFKHHKKTREHHHADPANHIRVTRTSRFAQKRGSFKGSVVR